MNSLASICQTEEARNLIQVIRIMYIKGMQRNVAAMGTRSRQHDNHSDCVGETVIGIVGNNFPVSR